MPRSADFLINVRGDTRHLDSLRRKIGDVGKEANTRTAPALAKVNGFLEGFAQRNQALFQTIQTLGGLSLALRGIVDAGNFVLNIFRRIGEAAVNTGRLINTQLIEPLRTLGAQAEASITQIGALFRLNVAGATELFDAFRQFARPLPIGTSELVNAATLLQSINLRPTEERLQGLVRASLAFRRPIQDVTSALQSLHSITLRRFGIRLRREGQTARIVFGDMTQEVRNTDRAIAQGLLDIFNRRFPNAIELASRDFDTAFAATRSIIQDVFITASRQLLPALTNIVTTVGQWVTNNEQLIQGTLDDFAARVGREFRAIGENADVAFRIILVGIRAATFLTENFLRFLNFTLAVFKTLEQAVRDFVGLLRNVAHFFSPITDAIRESAGAAVSLPGVGEAQSAIDPTEQERLNNATEDYQNNLSQIYGLHQNITEEIRAQGQAIDDQIPGQDLSESQLAAIDALSSLTPFTATALREANAELETLVGHVRDIGQEEGVFTEIRTALDEGLLSAQQVQELNQIISKAPALARAFQQVGISAQDLIPRDAVARLDALRAAAPSRGELLGLSAQDLRQTQQDTIRAINEINREFRLRGAQAFSFEDLAEFQRNLQEALRLAISPFFTEVTKGFRNSMNQAVRDVFDGNRSILGIFSQASENFVNGIRDGIAGSLSQRASRAFSRSFTRSVDNLRETLAPQLQSLRDTFSGFIDRLPAGVTQRGGALLSGGLAVAGGVQQGGVGGFISGAAGGASIGAALGGPVGAIVGGILGGVASLFSSGKSERIRVETRAFNVAEATTRDFIEGIGTAYIKATERGIQDFNALDADVLTGLAVRDYLRGVRTSLEGLPGLIREQALSTLDNFRFDAQTLFSEAGDPTLQSFRSFLEGGLSGRLTAQLGPVFTGIFESLGASAERASEFFTARFNVIAGSHSQEVARQLEQRFRQDFQALVELVGVVQGNTGIAGAVDRARFLIDDLGVRLESNLAFDAVIERARELIAALEVDERVAGNIREVIELLVSIPAQLSSQIRSTLSGIRSTAENLGMIDEVNDLIERQLRGNINSLNTTLRNQNLTIEQRSQLVRELQSNTQELVALERRRFNFLKQRELDALTTQLEIAEAQQEAIAQRREALETERQGLVDIIDLQRRNVQATLDAQRERLEAERDNLEQNLAAQQRLGDSFRQVLEQARDSLLNLRSGADSILSPAQRLLAITSEISGIQGRLGTAGADERIGLEQRLTRLFPQAVQLARQGFGEGSSIAFSQFRQAEAGLLEIQERAEVSIRSQEQILTGIEAGIDRVNAELSRIAEQEAILEGVETVLVNDVASALEGILAHEENLAQIETRLVELDAQQQLNATDRNSILAQIAEIEDRQFTVSEETRRILETQLSQQIALLSQQEGLQRQMVSELQGIRASINSLARAQARQATQTISPLFDRRAA